MCKKETLTSPEFLQWSERLRPVWDAEGTGKAPLLHRKMWEWLFISQALSERGLLREGSRGLGFGVGQEPLAALFASMGCTLVVTDLPPERAEADGWTSTDQFA